MQLAWYVIESTDADGDLYDVLGQIEAEDEQAALCLAAQYYEKPKANLIVERA